MSARQQRAGSHYWKAMVLVCLLSTLVVGLSACRGFFGQAPIAFIDSDDGGDSEVPVTITFDISGTTDPDGTIAAYVLEFGDGSTDAEGTDVADVITHDYEEAGTYTVILTITDNDGRIGMASATITVGPVMVTFAANRTAQYDIFRMEGDGTDQGAVRNTADDELFPDLVLGTRDRIAYAAEDGVRWDIFTMTTAGASVNPLTAATQTDSNQIQPSWLSDGAKIAYASNELNGAVTTSWEIFTMTAAGGTKTQLTTQTPSWAIAPAYSPVNDDILFVSDEDATGGSTIWLWDDSLGAAVELRDGDGRDGDASPAFTVAPSVALNLPAGAGFSKPAWSPDGTLIAYAAERTAGGIIDIYIMDADGLDPRDGAGAPITLEEYIDFLGVTNTDITTDDDEFCPYWLEDGSAVCFVKEDAGGDYQIYKVALDTGVITKLTETGNNITPTSKR